MHLVICTHNIKINSGHQLMSSNVTRDEHIFDHIARITKQVLKILICVHKILSLVFVDVRLS
jgi:hypothetical protein